MNKELQQIKIAEACGYVWDNGRIGVCGWWTDPSGFQISWGQNKLKAMSQLLMIDYLNDLNAMHEAESSLTEEQFYIYGSYLDTITLPKKSMPMCYVDSPEAGMYRELICATAAQRAEAFLKTLDLWEEGE